MFKYIIMFFSLFAREVYAGASCISCGSITNTITENLDVNKNRPGETLSSAEVSSSLGRFSTTKGQKIQWWVAYSGEVPSQAGSIQPGLTYFRVDDYISLALSVNFKACRGVMYAPFNVHLLSVPQCRPVVGKGSDEFLPVSFNTKIKIDKKMIGGTYGNNMLIAESGVCQPEGCASKQAVISKVYLNYNIVVPQNCTINAGQIVNVDFGEISSSAFKIAGARAEGVNPQSRTINMECTNIQAQANLTLRVQADSVSGNAIVSDNKDVGFVVADAAGKELTPNMLSSVIPFRLDDNASAHVPVKVWPVSVTGQKPKEGVVTSRGYLRVDFD
ncbi:fimbrial protein [Serratia ficaria]|nr:fimbrial protein [Serratia ficaria]